MQEAFKNALSSGQNFIFDILESSDGALIHCASHRLVLLEKVHAHINLEHIELFVESREFNP
jgi:hypothetical protein